MESTLLGQTKELLEYERRGICRILLPCDRDPM